MAEKRAKGDAPTSDAKRTRLDDGATKKEPPKSLADQIAAIKAKASSKQASGSTPPTATESPRVSGMTKAEEARAKANAMKARLQGTIARATEGGTKIDSQDPSAPRGGLYGTALHPALMSDSVLEKNQHRDEKQTKTSQRGQQDTTTERSENEARLRGEKRASALAEQANPYIDTSAPTTIASGRRAAKGLKFHEKGIFINQAKAMRKKQEMEALQKRVWESVKKTQDEDRVEKAFLVEKPPDIEWWDEPLVIGQQYPNFDGDPHDAEQFLKIRPEQDEVVQEVFHPIMLDPPKIGLFEQKPMPMTQHEMAKKRRQERRINMQHEQAKIRLGLQPPEPPKVKLSNLMRAIGDEAVKDPTAVEARIRREIAERADKHDQSNQQRKLTKEQRKEKNMEKAQKDAAKSLLTTVYRIDSLAYVKNRMKIDMNAKQCADLTGLVLTNPKVNLIIVEAGEHTTNFMKKLMLRRIQWTENAPSTAISAEKEADKDKRPTPDWLKPEDAAGRLKDLSGNTCQLVWEGEAKTRSFRRWRQSDCETEGAVLDMLENSHLQNMWQLAKNWTG